MRSKLATQYARAQNNFSAAKFCTHLEIMKSCQSTPSIDIQRVMTGGRGQNWPWWGGEIIIRQVRVVQN